MSFKLLIKWGLFSWYFDIFLNTLYQALPRSQESSKFSQAHNMHLNKKYWPNVQHPLKLIAHPNIQNRNTRVSSDSSHLRSWQGRHASIAHGGTKWWVPLRWHGSFYWLSWKYGAIYRWFWCPEAFAATEFNNFFFGQTAASRWVCRRFGI